MSDWLEFETLISRIYKTISPNANVKHNDSIPGIDSGIDRQIDVSIRFQEAGCKFLIIVQAKNYKKPVDINDVGEFVTVIKDVRASKGVLICNAGFTKGAQQLSDSIGIELWTAHDVETKDWKTKLRVPILWKRITPHVTFIFTAFMHQGDSIQMNPSEWIISHDIGKSKLNIVDMFVQKWNAREISQKPGENHQFVFGENKNLKIKTLSNNWRDINRLECIYCVEQNFYRKDVDTEDFTGLRNYITGNLEILKLGLELPKLEPENGWVPIDQNLEEYFSSEAIILTVEGPIIREVDFSKGKFMTQYLGKS